MPRILRNRWWTVFASVCGLLVGQGAINVFAFGVFLKPVTEDLGVGRGTLGFGLVLSSLLTALGCLPLGAMLDRWGARRVMIPGIALYAVATAGGALLQPAPLVIYLLFALGGVFGAVQSPIPYAAVLSHWFDRERGLALGIAMAGVGLGVALVPQYAQALIHAFGWRAAYVGLGLAVLVLAWLPVALFIREPEHARPAARGTAAERPGVTATRALASWRFWALTLAFLLGVSAINGTLTQIVALLTDRGVPVGVATAALSASGLAIILGRILSGWCLDRFHGPYVALGFFLIPMVGIAVLASGAGGSAPVVGAVLCGMGIGAEVDLMAFFTSRYFGLRAYGKIYGTMFAFFAIATGLGPYLAGAVFDSYHSYMPAFIGFEIALAVTCLLFLPLGAYPFPASREPAGDETGRIAA